MSISVMLAVPDTPAAVAWYTHALGARVLWSLGSVAGLELAGAAFFLHEPVPGRFDSPKTLGTTSARVEVFAESPEELIARAVSAGAQGTAVQEHAVPWGIHRQGGFIDPFGHVWHVGDRSPLSAWPPDGGRDTGR